jgi:starvation-inducible DNA-binding protein
MSHVVNDLTKFLSGTYALYLKTQNYHWNVKGPSFYSLHLLFEAHYTELTSLIDEIAERIAGLGAYVEGSFSDFEKRSGISPPKKGVTAFEMVKDLAESHKTLSDIGLVFVGKFSELGDEVSSDLMLKSITLFDKCAWMLKSHL